MGLTDYGRFTQGLLTQADLDEFIDSFAVLHASAARLALDRENRDNAVRAAEDWAGAFATLTTGILGLVTTHMSAMRGTAPGPTEINGIRERLLAQARNLAAGEKLDFGALLG